MTKLPLPPEPQRRYGATRTQAHSEKIRDSKAEMKLYKLTDKNGQTQGGTQWGDGVAHTAAGAGAILCTDGVIHCYESPLLAVFMDPVHSNYLRHGGLMFEARGDIVVSDGTKAGCKTLTTTHRIDVPEVTLTQHVAFGILPTQRVCDNPSWNRWARDWLNGKDRTARAARAARAAARTAVIDFKAIAEQAMQF